MKGVILAGGRATRLRPVTFVTNKHLLPVYRKPMIYYSLEAMARAGIRDVLLVTNPEDVGQFMNLLRTGKEHGVRLTYDLQDDPVGGIAQGISLAEHFADGSDLLVILGDNIFNHDLSPAVQQFPRQKKGARIFATKVEHPEHYGVVELDGEKVVSIVEKPKRPKSPYIQSGIYMYDNRVFDFIKTLKPSGRGELEVADLNNCYLDEGTLECEIMDSFWIDAGTSHDELLVASTEVARLTKEGKLD